VQGRKSASWAAPVKCARSIPNLARARPHRHVDGVSALGSLSPCYAQTAVWAVLGVDTDSVGEPSTPAIKDAQQASASFGALAATEPAWQLPGIEDSRPCPPDAHA
jgi:hypothetical protein